MPSKSTLISLLIAVSVIALCTFSWAVVSGTEYGFFYGVFTNPPTNGFAAHGPNYYQEHNLWYFKIIVFMMIFVAVKIVSARIGALISVLLVINLVLLWNMILFKNEILSLEVCCGYYPWLRTSVTYDGIAITGTFVLIVFELITYLRMRGSNISVK
jgi:hypothetical protein